MDVLFITSVAVITRDPGKSRELFVEALGLPLHPAEADADYFYSEEIDGARHFGVWPLSQAAQACFGSDDWPADRAVPQLSIEFEVAGAEAVEAAALELKARGFEVLHGAREEPWGQVVARLISGDGAIVGVSYAPWQHAAG